MRTEDFHVLFHKTINAHDVMIRTPVIADAPALQNYINTLSQEHTFILFQGKQMTLQQEEEWVKDSMQSQRSVKGLLFVDGVLAGVSDIDVASIEHANSPEGVFGISLAKEFRGQGYGKLLMKTVLDEAQRVLPMRVIILDLFGNNAVARKMYESFGFTEVGRIPNGILHNGQYVDDVTMMLNVK
ncbi:MAG: GNAT family N-acetyltransferase [Candidatus Kerfeldbacteria bacterium]|nr:GNAT family N-acetyltransferase [Candidatus Kerfeldbacteria bacterium]